MKSLFSIVSILTLLVAPIQSVGAAMYMGDEMIFVDSPINEDAYAAGGKVVFDSNVDGDLIVGGGNVEVNGFIAQDLTAAGGDLRIKGDIGDDVRIGGGDISILGSVEGDVIVFGGRIEIGSDSVIGGDLVVNGGEVTISGEIQGDALVNAGVTYVKGTVNGNLTNYGGELFALGTVIGNSEIVSDKITLGKDALFRGDVNYWSNSEVDFTAATAGTVTLDQDLKPYKEKHMREAKIGAAAALGALAAGAILYSLLSALLVIALLVLVTKTYFVDSAKIVRKEPWLNTLYGVMYFIVTPIAAILMMFTVIGIPIGATILAVYAISLTFAKPFAAVVLAKVWEQRSKNKKAVPTWKTAGFALIIFVLLKLVGSVPVFGWIVVFGVVSMTFGGMMRAEYSRYLKVR